MGNYSITMPNVVRPYMHSKGDDNMKSPTSSKWVCCQGRLWYAKPDVIGPFQCCSREMMAFHTRRRSIVCSGQGPGLNASPYVLQLYMLSKCDDAIPHRSHPTVSAVEGQGWHVTTNVIRPLVLPNGDDGIAHTISSHHVCCTKAIMASHS